MMVALMMRRQRLVLGALGLLGLCSAQAAETPWYAGGQLGVATTDISSSEVNRRMDDEGISGDATVDSATRVGIKLFLGYQWNETFGLEGGYTNLGNIKTEYNNIDPGLEASDLRGVRPGSGYGVELALTGRHAFTREIDGLVRAGMMRWTAEHRDNVGNNDTSRGTDPVFGLATEWHFEQNWSARGSWDRYRVENDDSDLFAVGVVYRFGRAEQPLTRQEELQARLPPPAELLERVWTIRFDVDEHDNEQAQAMIVELSEIMEAYPDSRLVLTGHTDSTGPAEYNRALSERRAAIVGDALIEQGVAGERLSYEGRGEDEPIADNATPEGRAENRRTEVRWVSE